MATIKGALKDKSGDVLYPETSFEQVKKDGDEAGTTLKTWSEGIDERLKAVAAFKGVYATSSALPESGAAGDYAVCQDTDTVWIWDADKAGGAGWIDSGGKQSQDLLDWKAVIDGRIVTYDTWTMTADGMLVKLNKFMGEAEPRLETLAAFKGVYANSGAMPSESVKQGDFCVATDTNTIWVYNGSSWVEAKSVSGTAELPESFNNWKDVIDGRIVNYDTWLMDADPMLVKLNAFMASDQPKIAALEEWKGTAESTIESLSDIDTWKISTDEKLGKIEGLESWKTSTEATLTEATGLSTKVTEISGKVTELETWSGKTKEVFGSPEGLKEWKDVIDGRIVNYDTWLNSADPMLVSINKKIEELESKVKALEEKAASAGTPAA